MSAYNVSYANDSACSLGELFDYMINVLLMDPDEVFYMFAKSSVGHNFENGNPAYIAGHSGIELAYMLIYEVKGYWEDKEYEWKFEKTPEYWAGWAIAQYQRERNIRFEDMINYSLSASKVIDMYVLHEADITKFISTCDAIITKEKLGRESMLKRLRMYHGLTQKELSEKSGVSLRMVQLYEQGQNDLSKAQVSVVLSLAKALDCTIEDLF